jgi:outer membrane protein W
MRKLAFAVAVIAAAASARAEGDGVSLSLRAGVGSGVGKVAGNTGASSMGDLYDATIPLWFEAGYRFNPSWSLGVYGQYAFAPVAGSAENSLRQAFNGLTVRDVSGRVLRLGVESAYKFQPKAAFAPWIGLGFGYEWAEIGFNVTDGTNTGDASETLKGFDLMLQAGGDYRVSPSFTVGPFVAFTFGWYSRAEVSASALGQSASQGVDIDNKSLHNWLQAGIRGTFELGR